MGGYSKLLKMAYCAWDYAASYTAIVICAGCCGMVMMGFLIGLYYFNFFPSTPGASLEQPGMYDYENEYQTYKRDVAGATEEPNVEDFYDESGRRLVSETNKYGGLWSQKTIHSGDYEKYVSGTQKDPFVNYKEVELNVRPNEREENGVVRGKRNDTTGPAGDSTKATTPERTKGSTIIPKTSTSTESKGKQTASSTTTPTTTTKTESSDPDFQLSNTFLDSVFSRAESANLRDPLGLCRSSTDIKIPNFNVTYFPVEDANDILACINGIVKNQTANKLCIQLDSELNAYLRWLVLTGEPKEKRKPLKFTSNEGFLFPTLCATQETPQETPRETQCPQ